MNDVHIEFSHIYNDQEFGEEQIQSVEILNEITNHLEKEKKSYITSILVDNFNVSECKWDAGYVVENVKKWGTKPDIIAFEGSFANVAEEIISKIPDQYKRRETFKKDKKEVLFFVDEKRKFALKDMYESEERHKCVILSCAWLLCRLGVFQFPEDGIMKSGKEISTVSEEVLSVLPKKYKDVEDNVLRLLSCIGLEEEKKRVRYVFY